MTESRPSIEYQGARTVGQVMAASAKALQAHLRRHNIRSDVLGGGQPGLVRLELINPEDDIEAVLRAW
jgi:hypothetical protein